MKKKAITILIGMSLCLSACSLPFGNNDEPQEEPEIIAEEISVDVEQVKKESEQENQKPQEPSQDADVKAEQPQADNSFDNSFAEPVIKEDKEFTYETLNEMIPKEMTQDMDFEHGHLTQTICNQDGEIHIKTDTGKTTLDMYMKGSDIVYKLMLGDNEYAGKTSMDDWQGKVSVNSGYVHKEDTITYLGSSENQTGIFDVVQAEGSGKIRYYFDKDQNLVYMETTDMSTGKPAIISISKAKDEISLPDWADTVDTDENEQGFGTAFMIAMFAASGGDEDADYSSYEGKTMEEIAQEFAAKSFGQMMPQAE